MCIVYAPDVHSALANPIAFSDRVDSRSKHGSRQYVQLTRTLVAIWSNAFNAA